MTETSRQKCKTVGSASQKIVWKGVSEVIKLLLQLDWRFILVASLEAGRTFPA